MADDERFQHTWTVDGTPYTFRVPSSKDMREIQIATVQLLGGDSDVIARSYAQQVMALQRTCVSDPMPDFDTWPEPWVDALVREVTAWWASFRDDVRGSGGSVGGGGRDGVAVPVSTDLPSAPA